MSKVGYRIFTSMSFMHKISNLEHFFLVGLNVMAFYVFVQEIQWIRLSNDKNQLTCVFEL